MRAEEVAEISRRLIRSIESVIVGKRETVELLVAAFLAGGHVLLDDVPGTGKTTLARSLAASLDLSFKRIQCTPDLLPSDVTGVNVFDPRSSEFSFRPGPVFAGVVLADEVNRATPRTQAALLEAMQERQVTVDGESRRLPHPFMLIATQNPVEFEGTFPLPEAQLDRFLLSLRLGYPSLPEEAGLVERMSAAHPLDQLRPVVAPDELAEAMRAVAGVHLEREVAEYVAGLAAATRAHPGVELGASTRAAIALGAAARALAASSGRDFVLPDDVKRLAVPALAHRLVLTPEARLHGREPSIVLLELLEARQVESGVG